MPSFGSLPCRSPLPSFPLFISLSPLHIIGWLNWSLPLIPTHSEIVVNVSNAGGVLPYMYVFVIMLKLTCCRIYIICTNVALSPSHLAHVPTFAWETWDEQNIGVSFPDLVETYPDTPVRQPHEISPSDRFMCVAGEGVQHTTAASVDCLIPPAFLRARSTLAGPQHHGASDVLLWKKKERHRLSEPYRITNQETWE